ncbi:hypothetical protein AYO47_00820 [Planctomyces sp. SCGC AG-212-M04]|nr:hypothetical protein AYO47_00820 [Planctomyces sp. SCGC AG-212-M04]
MQKNVFQIDDIFNLEGRAEVFTVLKVVQGSFDEVTDPLSVDDLPEARWRISQAFMPKPWASEGRPIMALEGPKTLVVGMILHD